MAILAPRSAATRARTHPLGPAMAPTRSFLPPADTPPSISRGALRPAIAGTDTRASRSPTRAYSVPARRQSKSLPGRLPRAASPPLAAPSLAPPSADPSRPTPPRTPGTCSSPLQGRGLPQPGPRRTPIRGCVLSQRRYLPLRHSRQIRNCHPERRSAPFADRSRGIGASPPRLEYIPDRWSLIADIRPVLPDFPRPESPCRRRDKPTCQLPTESPPPPGSLPRETRTAAHPSRIARKRPASHPSTENTRSTSAVAPHGYFARPAPPRRSPRALRQYPPAIAPTADKTARWAHPAKAPLQTTTQILDKNWSQTGTAASLPACGHR